MFGRHTTSHTTSRRHHRFGRFGRKDPDRVAGGYSTSHNLWFSAHRSQHGPTTFYRNLSAVEPKYHALREEARKARAEDDGASYVRLQLAVTLQALTLLVLAQGRGREAHVPLMTKIKRTLGIRSTPRSERKREHRSVLRRRERY